MKDASKNLYHDFMGWGMPWYSAQASLDWVLTVKGEKCHSKTRA